MGLSVGHINGVKFSSLSSGGGGGAILPADYGDGAPAAFSLRYVSADYSGAVIRVRRTSDSAESDFTPTEIEDGTLTSFCGVTDGFVTTFYDQSGNSYNMTQGSTSKQPKIVSSGTLITDNGKPAMQFQGNMSLRKTLALGATQLFVICVCQNQNWRGAPIGVPRRIVEFCCTVTSMYVDSNSHLFPIEYWINDQDVATPKTSSCSGCAPAQQNLHFQTGTRRFGQTILQVGESTDGADDFIGLIQEVIFYPVNMTDDIPDMQEEINSFYSIW